MNTFILAGTELIPECQHCNKNTGVSLVDVLSTEEQPWSMPVWYCKPCSFIYAKRTKTMDNLAMSYAKSARKHFNELPVIPVMGPKQKRHKDEIDRDKNIWHKVDSFTLK